MHALKNLYVLDHNLYIPSSSSEGAYAERLERTCWCGVGCYAMEDH